MKNWSRSGQKTHGKKLILYMSQEVKIEKVALFPKTKICDFKNMIYTISPGKFPIFISKFVFTIK